MSSLLTTLTPPSINMSYLRNYLFGSSPPTKTDSCSPCNSSNNTAKKGVRALPASWYISQEMYELEKRAIFTKMWLLTTHQTRLTKAGDWILYDMANFEFFVTRNPEGKIKVFHNVCPHSTSPIVEAEHAIHQHSENFTCKLNGFTYDTNGRLIKAPNASFLEKEPVKNGLLPIHVHIDNHGFVWINLDSSETPMAWEDGLGGADTQPRLDLYDWADYEFDHMWSMEAPANWKLSADNYNECYHCKTTHPDLVKTVDLETYKVETEGLVIRHFGNPRQQVDWRVAPNYYFPNASTNISPYFFFIQKFVPSGPCKTKMVYEVYRNMKAPLDEYNNVDAIYKRVMSEDKALVLASHKNIERGVFINGEMHPNKEQGPIFFQKLCRETVMAHAQEEKEAGHAIWSSAYIPGKLQPRVPVVEDVVENQLETVMPSAIAV